MQAVNWVQASFNAGELSPLMDARTDQERYPQGCRSLVNFCVMPHGPAYRRPGTRHAAVAGNPSFPSRLVPFQFSTLQAYVLEFFVDEAGQGTMRVFKDGGQVLDGEGQPYRTSTPFDTEAKVWSLRFCQTADVMYFAQADTPPHKLIRHGHDDWRFEPVAFGPDIPAPANPSATVGGNGGSTEYRYKVASVGPTDEESLASAEVVVADAAATLTSSARVELAWDAVEGATHYRVYRAVNGVYGFVGKAVEAAYTDEGDRSPDLDDTPPELRRPFQEPGDYPSCVQFFEQRLMWAASENDPQRIWGSQTVHYHNHNVSTPLRDDDALSYTIVADRVNAVRWMMPGKRRLLFGTAGGEWTMAGANGDPLTPLSVETSRETVRGSAALPPVTAGSTVLFAQRPGNVVREFRYSLEEDGFAATDVSILSEHVLGPSRIRDWAYQQSPASIVWIAREDGALVGLTYLREHKVVGWHRHATDGRVVSLTSIPGPESGPGQAEDEVWLCVERETDGVKRHAVERLAPLFSGDHAETAFFVDAGLSLDAWNDDPAATLTLTPDDPIGPAGTQADLTAEGFAPFGSMAAGDRYRLRAPLPQPWAGGAADRDTACEVELTEIVSPTRARARLRTNLPERLNGAATPHHAAPVSRLFGLDHLQGRRVQVLADGTVQPEVVVGDASSAPWATCEWGAGEIELPRPTALVHAGLGYVSDLSPMKPELPDGLGPSQGRIKRVALGAVRLHNSLGLKAGSGEDSLERVPFEDERMGAAAPLFSGDKAVSLEAEPSPDAALLLRQDLPLPCTVLAVMLKLEVMAP